MKYAYFDTLKLVKLTVLFSMSHLVLASSVVIKEGLTKPGGVTDSVTNMLFGDLCQ